jgi:hypothetical protein
VQEEAVISDEVIQVLVPVEKKEDLFRIKSWISTGLIRSSWTLFAQHSRPRDIAR